MTDITNPLGFDALSPTLTAEQKKQFDEATREHTELMLDFARIFGTPGGKRVMQHLRKMTIENAAWCASLGMENGVAHGFAREGQNSIVRYIEECIEKAKLLTEQKGQSDVKKR